MENSIENSIECIARYMQEIQSDLVGIVVPTLITAAVALITLLVNSLIVIDQNRRKWNCEQFKSMQIIYPKVKDILLSAYFSAAEAESAANEKDSAISSLIIKWFEYQKDKEGYRKKYSDEYLVTAKLMCAMEKYIGSLLLLNRLLSEAIVPATPSGCPVIKRKVKKMLLDMNCCAYLIEKRSSTAIDENYFEEKVENYHLTTKKLKDYLAVIEEWYTKY